MPIRPLTSRIALLCLCTLAVSLTAYATDGKSATRDLQVNPAAGHDTNDGIAAPVKTIARAVKLSQPGDTIHLAPGTYYESLDLTLKHGEPNRPITVDGHGAVLEGSEPVTAAEWESLGGGLFRKVKLISGMNPATVGRWFFLWNGKMNHMGRTSKAPGAALKQVKDLQPDEWTYVTEEDAFYLRLKEGQNLDEAKIRYPKRSNGVIFSRTGAHLTVKNITATHVWNDGFNVHGDQKDLRFENIAAIECGDDGFSAHETAECRIDGFTSIGNSTGLCDVGLTLTHYKNVLIKDCLAYDVFFIGLDHALENAMVESSARWPFAFDGGRLPEGMTAKLRMKNVWIRRTVPGTAEARSGGRGVLDAESCTFTGMHFSAGTQAEVSLKQCVISGNPAPQLWIRPSAKWAGQNNRYQLTSALQDKTTFTPAKFAEFQQAVGGEEGSQWVASGDVPTGAGANEAMLKDLRRP